MYYLPTLFQHNIEINKSDLFLKTKQSLTVCFRLTAEIFMHNHALPEL